MRVFIEFDIDESRLLVSALRHSSQQLADEADEMPECVDRECDLSTSVEMERLADRIAAGVPGLE